MVSLLDYSGGIYYAIIVGFLIDQYASHYAVLKWVLPRTPNPTHFDPSNFILGMNVMTCTVGPHLYGVLLYQWLEQCWSCWSG